jgi:hypothetical protein
MPTRSSEFTSTHVRLPREEEIKEMLK